MERVSFNNAIKKKFLNPQAEVASILQHKTNAFLESYISEGYIKKKMAMDCLVTSYDWWLGSSNGKRYAIHIGDSLKPIDVAFSRELANAGYESVFVILNEMEQKASFYYNGDAYELEILVEHLQLKEKTTCYKVNQSIDALSLGWCYQNLDYKRLVYHDAIEKMFLSKYFDFLTNLDVVWVNKVGGQTTFFIGEVKFKSKNKGNVFVMNLGEKNLYEHIVKNTSIQAVAIALVCSRQERQCTLVELMNNKEFPIFYMQLREKDFENLLVKTNQVSEFGKQNGQALQNTVEFSFQKFERVFDFCEIGRNSKTFASNLNKMLTKYSHLLNGNKSHCKKHIAKFCTLFRMQADGFNISYEDYLNEDCIKENVLHINGYSVLFKFVENPRAWNLTMSRFEFENAKKRGVDFVLVYQEKFDEFGEGISIEEACENGRTFYLVNESTPNNAIAILGCLPFEIFEKYSHCLDAGVPSSQRNYYASRGLYCCKVNMEDKAFKSSQDTYFLQVLGGKPDGSDEEPSECRLSVYDKSKGFPFLSSYVIY